MSPFAAWTRERTMAAADSVWASRGPLDETWNRGEPGSPLFHNAPGGHCASVEVEMGQRIMALVEESRPDVLVEVGTNKGMSSAWLMMGMLLNGRGRLTTFDIEDVRAVHGTPYWESLGLPASLVDYAISPVWGNPPQLPASIDFVFHDASHDEEPTRRELEALEPRMSARGVMAFHDVFLCRHQGEVLLKFFGSPEMKAKWSYEEWQRGRGLGIARRR